MSEFHDDPKGHLTDDKAVAKVRDLLPRFRSAMLVTGSGAGDLPHVRPMGLLGDLASFGGTLWFFADDRSRKVQELADDPHASLVFQSDDASRYMHLNGRASVADDRAKMRELFTPIIKTWFPDGLDDPHLILIRFDAENGAFWDSPGGMLQVLAAFTKAMVTGVPGNGGRMGTLEI
jgi:general stress protein 26